MGTSCIGTTRLEFEMTLYPTCFWVGASIVNDRSDGAGFGHCGRVYRHLLRRNRWSWRKTTKTNTKIRSTVGHTVLRSSCDREFGVCMQGFDVRTESADGESSRERRNSSLRTARRDSNRSRQENRDGDVLLPHDVRLQYPIVTPSVYTIRCRIRVH